MMDEGLDLKEVMAIVDSLVQGLRAELGARWDAWERDLTKPQLHEAIGGLMARQVSLATQLAQAPSIWNGHVAPLILRSMTDAYITLAWILEEPEKRTDDFVKYGLGQRKLWLEHFKMSLVKRGEKEPEKNQIVKAITIQLNAERFEHITEVSVGAWSERSTRQMAEEAGCLDLYRLAARGKSPAAFDRRCIPLRGVVHRSNTAGIFPLLALLSGRSADLGATRGFTTDC